MKLLRTVTCFSGLATLAAAALHVLAACSTSDSKGPVTSEDAAADAIEEPAPLEPVDAGVGPACKLTAKMTTGVAICDECLQKGCCQALVACLGEGECSALNDCYNGCRTKFGTTDAGAQCARDCVAGKDEPAKRLNDALECESTRCLSQCK